MNLYIKVFLLCLLLTAGGGFVSWSVSRARRSEAHYQQISKWASRNCRWWDAGSWAFNGGHGWVTDCPTDQPSPDKFPSSVVALISPEAIPLRFAKGVKVIGDVIYWPPPEDLRKLSQYLAPSPELVTIVGNVTGGSASTARLRLKDDEHRSMRTSGSAGGRLGNSNGQIVQP
jgi:hypothetical protein